MNIKKTEIQYPIGVNIVGLPQYAVHTFVTQEKELPYGNHKNVHSKTSITGDIVTG